MSPAPALLPVSQDIWDELGPSLGPQDEVGEEHLLANLIATTGAPLQVLHDLALGDARPLAIALDPDRCPLEMLPWCAGMYGVVLPELSAYLTFLAWETAARTLIRERPARRRGTLPALAAAVREVLPDVAFLRIVRRRNPADFDTDSRWELTILTLDGEPPSSDVILAAAEPHRPRGHRFHHLLATGTPWYDLTGTTWDDLTGYTWQDLTDGNFP